MVYANWYDAGADLRGGGGGGGVVSYPDPNVRNDDIAYAH